MPDTPLPPVAGLVRDGAPVPGIASADFKGAVTLVNVWASWCVPCHDEAPLLMKLAEDKRIRIVGINYKDQPENARRFIGRYGNPFAAVGADANGRASIDWGVYGVPETFVIGRDGRIAYKLVGPITPANLDAKPQLGSRSIEKALAAIEWIIAYAAACRAITHRARARHALLSAFTLLVDVEVQAKCFRRSPAHR